MSDELAGDGNGYPTALDLPYGAPVGWYDKKGRLRGSDAPKEGRCGKKLRGTDPPRYCTNRLGAARTACRFHGGKSPSGVASGRWTTGRYSKYLPKGINDAYRRATSDKDLLSLRSDVALIQARQIELLKQLKDSPPPTEEQKRTWAEINDLVDRKTRTVMAEHRRTLDLNNVLTAEEAAAFISALIAAAKELIFPADAKLYRALCARVVQLLPGPEV